MSHTILVIIFFLLLIPGLLMTLVPMFPALLFLLIVAVSFALIDGFVHVTGENITLLAGIAALSLIVDWSSGLLGAKFGGANWRSMLLGFSGSIIGFFVLPPLGALLGLFVGIFFGEMLRRHNQKKALRAATGALVGSLTGIAVNAVLALIFVVLFVVFAIR